MSGEGKVIKPPMEEVATGKVFRPSKKFRNKMWFLAIFSAIMLWLLMTVALLAVFWLIAAVGGFTFPQLLFMFNYWWPIFSTYLWMINAIWFIPYVIIYPIYLRAFEYSVIARSGQTMPEIYTKKGLINITRKHVPFRTITNISSRAGIFDRMFGIGTVDIETAGSSAAQGLSSGAEERLEGLTFYEELRDFILKELRKFKDPYVTGTEVVHQREEYVPTGDSDLEDEVLSVLREIRDLLRERK